MLVKERARAAWWFAVQPNGSTASGRAVGVLVDALALFNGERTRDIVKRASTGPAVLASGTLAEDVEKGLFADLDPATRAWVLDRYTPHPTGCSETPVRLTDFGDQTSSRLAVIALMNAAPSGSSLSARPNTM